jgi:CBS domain-containing protein
VLKTEAAMMLSLGASARMGDRRVLGEGDVETALSPDLAWILPNERLIDRVRLGIRLTAEGLQFVPATAQEPNQIELPRTEPLWIELSWKDVEQRFARTVNIEPGRIVLLPETPSEVTLRTLAGDQYLIRMVARDQRDRRSGAGLGRILQPEIRSLIDARNFSALRELFSEWPPADVAEVIIDFSEDEQVIVFRVLKHDLAADVFEYLDVEAQQKLLRGMAHEQVVGILNEMSPDDRSAMLEEMPSAAARQLIRLLTPEERRVALALLGYPEGSVGHLMTPDFIAVHDDWAVKEVLDHVREFGRDSETLNIIYVVDERGKLLDDLRIRELLIAPLDKKVSELMDETFVALNVTDSQEAAVNIFRKYDRTALPVLGSDGILLGVVTIDDMLDVAEEEASGYLQESLGTKSTFNPMGLLKNLWKRISERPSK